MKKSAAFQAGVVDGMKTASVIRAVKYAPDAMGKAYGAGAALLGEAIASPIDVGKMMVSNPLAGTVVSGLAALPVASHIVAYRAGKKRGEKSRGKK